MSILSNSDTIAVVGTRAPTQIGMERARKIAYNMAKSGYVIVSGLAKGIDTAAHLGALEANGSTIAVLGTPLDKIYPAENESLAHRIETESGVLISEYPLGPVISRGAFVQRDRVQSGLSTAVFAIQTDVEGGTMHTVRYAQKYNRLIFCPELSEAEVGAKQNAGIVQLIRSSKARTFSDDNYQLVLRSIKRHKENLMVAWHTAAATIEKDSNEPVIDQRLDKFIS